MLKQAQCFQGLNNNWKPEAVHAPSIQHKNLRTSPADSVLRVNPRSLDGPTPVTSPGCLFSGASAQVLKAMNQTCQRLGMKRVWGLGF